MFKCDICFIGKLAKCKTPRLFSSQLQMFGYNSDLYANMSEAMDLRRSEGLVGISILLQVTEPYDDLRIVSKVPKQRRFETFACVNVPGFSSSSPE